MKSLIPAEIATLSIGTRAIFAEIGDSYEWSQRMPAAITIARPAQSQAYDDAATTYSATKSTTSGLAALQQAVMPQPVTSVPTPRSGAIR